MKKSLIRQKILLKRTSVHTEEVCQTLRTHLQEYLLSQPLHSVGFYWPIKNEISVIETIITIERDFELALPKVVNGKMDFYRWRSTEAIGKDEVGVPAPLSDEIVVPELVLVPCLAMDGCGYRLGYGQGWYDRYLAQYPFVQTIGIVANEFIFDQLPHEMHDRPLDAFISESGLKQLVCHSIDRAN